ncbi:leucine--tRNA ligase [Candidatus Woesearchaeota archaeon]|nr:leucine--tRNA ligase [Candidatus Woesearchaeota archaeon]
MANFNKIAAKWQKEWEKAKIFKVKEDSKKKKFYVLEMYPYPSASGLHMGHARNYCIGDAYARYKRMNGYNVLYPMGYDSFGLPAENAAIKAKSHPKKFTEASIKNFIKQQKALGLSYDWSRMVTSHDPDFYKWDQWVFLKMYEKKLSYKRKSVVNWCPKCKTVLANEQVHSGKCWRHTTTEVEVKDLEQWFFKITKYADELLKDIKKLKGWAEDVKTMQENWIGRSEGALMDFKIEKSNKKLSVFTTRPDTFYGITFLVYAPEHPDVMELVKGTKYEKDVKKFVRKVVLEDKFMRTAEDKEKEGMFIGKHAINQITKEKIPIYIANFVLYEYGTGAIIAVPAHDQRDFEFAKKYKIPIKVVINPSDYELNAEKMSRSYMGDGIMTNSEEFDGMNNREAIPKITKFLAKNKCGKATVQYKLRDWLISRQRFWGCPIPIIYCDKCGVVPVPEKDLPVKLPENFKFTVGKGNPLEHCKKFVSTKCPKCKGKARRETDTMDTFVDSSWYFLRYCDATNKKKIFDQKKVNYWMPIDQYIGGKEHATMHLIYFRFFTKFLRDLKLLKFDEPTLNLFNQGMLHKNGVVMSKSKGNVVMPEEVAKKYGIDTGRLFLMFVASPEKDMEWSDKGVEGTYRFLNKFYNLFSKKIVAKIDRREASKLHKTIKEVTECIQSFKFNLAIIKIMDLTNYLHNKEKISKESAENLVLLMSPFAPHTCEELWKKLGKKPFVSLAKWPKHNEKKIDEKAEAEEQLTVNLNADINALLKLIKVKKIKKIRLFVSSNWKYKFFKQFKKEVDKTRDVKAIIGAIMKSPLKKYGQDITKMIPVLVKDASKVPEVVLDQKTELKQLNDYRNVLEKEYKCAVEVEVAEKSKEAKAKQANPGKPAIVIE